MDLPFDPILVVGPFRIAWHSFWSLVAMGVGSWVSFRLARWLVKDERIYPFAIAVVIGGLVGARVAHVLDNWNVYGSRPLELLAFWNGGIGTTGAPIGSTIAGFFVATKWLLYNPARPDAWWMYFLCGMIGVLTSIVFVFITQYYTEYKYRPVREIAEASQTGPATNVIAGIAVGLECTLPPVVAISIAILFVASASKLRPLGGTITLIVAYALDPSHERGVPVYGFWKWAQKSGGDRRTV